MSDIIVPVTQEDKVAVANAIQELNSIRHVKHMSRAMLVDKSGISDTRLRAVLQTMVDEELVIQLKLTDNPRLQRYYYVLTDTGKELNN